MPSDGVNSHFRKVDVKLFVCSWAIETWIYDPETKILFVSQDYERNAFELLNDMANGIDHNMEKPLFSESYENILPVARNELDRMRDAFKRWFGQCAESLSKQDHKVIAEVAWQMGFFYARQ